MKYTPLLAALLFPCTALAAVKPAESPLLPVEQFTLDNGLRVVFHVDRSDPVVAVALAAHVGSARELPGRTGFAHLFEHLYFLDSENLGPGGLDKLSARVGGSGANGNTNRDLTVYHQEVPNDALEKMLWADADKLGYFINTVTGSVVAKEIQVVKNEKRQSYDNQPYGFSEEVLSAAMYPAGHPYSHTVIGSLADLDAAKLADVQAFNRRWYVPNNTTLVVAGDFDTAQARAWIEKYFGGIPRGADAPRAQPQPAVLAQSRSLVFEDDFAQLPELTLAWPAMELTSPDLQPMRVLLDLLAQGKDSPLHSTLVDELKLTSEVGAQLYSTELAGEAYLTVRGFEGTDLDRVQAGLDAGLARFGKAGVDPQALARVKTLLEKDFLGNLSDVEDKAQLIARFDALAGRADFGDEQLRRLRAVSADDVMRVYRQYLQGKPRIATSFVPRGQVALALEGAEPAQVVKEKIVQGAEAEIDAQRDRRDFARTPSSFDRTVEPPSGPTPQVRLPAIWNATLADGLRVSGIESRELPLVAFELAFDGGRLFDDPAQPGAMNLLSRLFTRGTAKRTPAELENALKSLGAEVEVRAEKERTVVAGSTLARNFDATMALLREMLLEPRWDADELALAKSATVSEIQSNRAEPDYVAARVMDTVTYGPGHVLSRDPLGTEASVAALTMDDLRAAYARAFAPEIARLRLVGAIDEAAATAALASLGAQWKAGNAQAPHAAMAATPAKAALYFYDIPDAKQSMLLFGGPALRRADPDFHAATVMNYILGGGGFASRLTQQLREGKGYTYGIRSRFTGGRDLGTFAIESPVRSNVTLEAAQLVRQIVSDYGATFTDADLDVTKSFLTRSRARAFESLDGKLQVLANIGDFGLPVDYVEREGRTIEAMTVARIQELAAKYLQPDRMTYIVVGDKATQAARLEALGVGAAIQANGLLEEGQQAKSGD
jgi:zinc protease